MKTLCENGWHFTYVYTFLNSVEVFFCVMSILIENIKKYLMQLHMSVLWVCI